MTGGPQRGAALAELLVSLALTGAVMASCLPAVLAARSTARQAGALAAAVDGGRLASLGLARDLGRAGFGLDGSVPGVALEDAGLVVRFLDGGFAGGVALTETATAGQRVLRVAGVGSFRVGDQVWLCDRQGGAGPYRVADRDVAAGALQLDTPLPRDFRPDNGARLYRLVERHWRRDGELLRRDGQPAVDGVAGLDVAAWPAGEGAEALAWRPQGAAAPADPGLAGARLTLRTGRAGFPWSLTLLMSLDNADGIGSPLP